MGSAMHGDRLLAEVVRRPRGRAPEARVVRVLDRARDEVVGVFHEARAGAFVVPLDRRLGREISIVRDGGLAAEDGEVVVVRIEKYGDHRSRASGAVRQVLGRLGEAGVDVLAVALGYGIATDFPAAVEEEAARVAELGTEDAAPGRADRTDLLIFTIDPSDAKDHDDALSFRAMEDGTAEIGVHIADVAYFVTPGSPLDDEALARGTSVYLVDRTIPMLPDVLSGGVCSLHAEADRLAVSTTSREGSGECGPSGGRSTSIYPRPRSCSMRRVGRSTFSAGRGYPAIDSSRTTWCWPTRSSPTTSRRAGCRPCIGSTSDRPVRRWKSCARRWPPFRSIFRAAVPSSRGTSSTSSIWCEDARSRGSFRT
jgi:hypothetical protein